MLVKINDYKGVIIFYILLILLLFAISYQNKVNDMQNINNSYQTINN